MAVAFRFESVPSDVSHKDINLVYTYEPTLLQNFKLGHVRFEILTKFNSNDDLVELFFAVREMYLENLISNNPTVSCT